MILSKMSLDRDKSRILSFLLLPLLFLFYIVIEITDEVNLFTLILFHISFTLLFQSWKLRNVSTFQHLLQTEEDDFSIAHFIAALLNNLFGRRTVFFLLNFALLLIFYGDLINADLIYFMTLVFLYAMIIDVPSFLAALKSVRQYKIQSAVFGFIGSAMLTSSLLQELYYVSIKQCIVENLSMLNCVLFYALPIVVATAFYSYRMTLMKETKR